MYQLKRTMLQPAVNWELRWPYVIFKFIGKYTFSAIIYRDRDFSINGLMHGKSPLITTDPNTAQN